MSVDLRTRVGSVSLTNPVMTASGCAGHGAELARYMDLSSLGAVVTKSVSAGGWAGDAAPRLYESDAGQLNSDGVQKARPAAWVEGELPAPPAPRAGEV